MKFQTNDVVIVSKRGCNMPIGRIGRVYSSNEYYTWVCFGEQDCYVGDKKITTPIITYYKDNNGIVREKPTYTDNYCRFENDGISPYTGNAECDIPMFYIDAHNGRDLIMEQTNVYPWTSDKKKVYKLFLKEGKYTITKESLLSDLESIKDSVKNINFDNIEENDGLMLRLFYFSNWIKDAKGEINGL